MPTPPPAEADKQSASVGNAGKVSFSGLAEPCAIGSLVEVVINAQGATQGSVLVEAIAPTGKRHRCQVHQRGNTFTATFTPNEVGEWQIAIMYDSEHIRGSPFVCHVYDANLVRVYGLDVGVVGQELKFNVNTSHAGRGDIQVQVSHHGRSIPCYQEKQGAHLYRIQFTPDGPGHYKIHVYFNNMEVKGSPFSLDIVDASSVSVYGDNLRMASVDKLVTFMIHAVGADSKDLTVTINAPSGKKKRARVVPMGDSTYRVEWKPVEAGEHYIDVRLYNQSVQDGPFSCNVGDPELVTVRNMPTHIKHTELGEPQSFEIDASAAGSGNLEILINGGRVGCKVKELGNRLYLATFIPVHPVTHIIEMRFNAEPVKGSPWRIEVNLPTGSTETHSNISASMLTAVGAPTGIPVLLTAPMGFPGASGQLSGNYAAYLTTAPTNFQTPLGSATGGHTTTFSSEIERVTEELGTTRFGTVGGGPMWAEIEGRGLTKASVGKVASFEIGGRGLNVDDIEVHVSGPTGKVTPMIIAARTGNFRCEYVTTDVGTYRIDMSLAGRAVDGSPFYVSSYSPQRVTIAPITEPAIVGQPVQFFVDANDAGKGQLEISVNQGRVPNNVQMQGTGRCLVTFIPETVGTYVIDVTFNGELVPRCPVRVEIYDKDATGASVEHRPILATDGSRFPKPHRHSPSSPDRGTREWSPSVGGANFATGTSYNYEKREYSSSNNFTNGDRGMHTTSVSYYLPGQPVTVHLTPVTTTSGTSGHVTTTTSTVPPAPPPPPPPMPVPIIHAGGKPLVKTWQNKITPTESPNEMKKFEISETKRIEHTLTLATESKHAYQSQDRGFKPISSDNGHLDRDHTQQYRNGSAIYDRGISPPSDHKSSPPMTTGHRPRVTETTTVESYHQEELIKTHHRPGGHDDPHYGRLYKYESEDRPVLEKRKSEEKLDYGPSGVRKYYDRQQTPPKSEFEERLARKAADREEKYASGTIADTSKGAATTVASYGLAPGYRRLGSDTVSPTHVLTPEPELTQMPVTDHWDTTRSSSTSHDYAIVEKDKPKPESQIREIPVQMTTVIREMPVQVTREIREIPIHVTREISDQRKDHLPVPLKSSDASASWSGSSASDLAEDEDLVHDQKTKDTHLSGISAKPDSKIDLKSIKIEFPDAIEAAGGVAVVKVRKSTFFEIKPAIFNKDDLKINIVTPSKSSLDHRIKETRQGFIVEYTPSEVGTHKAHLQIRDETLFQSPYVIKVYDSDRIQVTGIDSGVVGNAVQFTVDATNAGYGSLEIAIKDSDGNIIPSKVNAMQDSTSKFTVSFLPQKADKYGIHVSFNQENLKGSPFLTEVKEKSVMKDVATISAPAATVVASQMASEIMQQAAHSPTSPVANGASKIAAISPTSSTTSSARLVGEEKSKEKSLKLAPVGKTATMLIAGVEKGKPKVDVKGPNGKLIHSQCVDAGGGTYKIEFGPQMVGDHMIDVKLGDTHVQGSPFTCRVYDSRKIKVGDIPNGVIGKPVHFIVDAGEAGVGNLEVAVNEGRIPSMAHALGQHRYDISFVPKDSVEHTISVRFNNEPVPGSPFICKIVNNIVTASGPGLERVPVKRPTVFNVDVQGAPNANLHVIMKDPTGQELPVNITGGPEKGFKVEYTPQLIGNHSIDVRYGNSQIQNNPFMIKAYDSNRVKLFPVEGNVVGKACSFQIDAAKAGAGNMEIIVSVDGRNVPNYVTPEGNAKFKVAFTPQEAKQHMISVKFNGEAVPGSPMTCDIVDDHAFLVIGEGLNQAVVGKAASFIVQASDGVENDCNVVITAPSQKIVPVDISKKSRTIDGDLELKVQFTPTEMGPHSIKINGKSDPSKGPFRCNVFDPTQVRVSKIGPGIVGKPVKIHVDISKAGDGTISVDIEDPIKKSALPCQIISTSMGSCFEITFTPIDACVLSIHIFFNGVEIPGCPYKCDTFDSCLIEATGSGLTSAQIDHASNFLVDLSKDGHGEDLVVNIIDPSKRIVPYSMKKSPTDNSKYLIEYVAKDIGTHIIEITFADYPIIVSPFVCESFDAKRVKVKNLNDGQVGKEQKFEVDCTEAGQGYLDVLWRNKNTSTRCAVNPIRDSVYSCSFIPKSSGPQSVEISFNGVALPDSPFDCFIRDTLSAYAQGPGLHQAVVHKISNFTVFLAGAGRGELDVVVTAPDGGAVPVKCFQQKDGNFRVEYTPSAVGTHRIDITFGDHPISGSPYTCEVFDPNRVTVQSDIHSLLANQQTSIKVNRKGSGKAALAVQVIDPNGKLLPVEVVPITHNEDEIRFTPSTPGQHQISVTYGGYDAANSPIPLIFNTDEPGMPSAYGDGLSRAIVNEPASFIVDVKKLKGELKVDITDHNGQRAKHSVRKKGDGLYETTFTPFSPGTYTVTLMWNNKQLTGSPFWVPVLDTGKIIISDASSDRTEGTPIRVGVQKEVKIDTSNAGPGKLRAEVRGTSGKLHTKLEELGNGQYKLLFTPTQEGEYAVYLYWSDMPVPSCPAIYWAEKTTGGPVIISDMEIPKTKEAKRGKKEGTESPASAREVAGRGSMPSNVLVNTQSLHGAMLGEEMQAIIDPRSAGPGELTAQCVGPNKLAYCELYGRHDGTYTLHFRPFESGRHNLHVKYDGEHVPGSPFALTVSSPPDPSKVRVFGSGVEHGILSKFKSDFTVDTQGAGAGQLTVRVRGPKAAFNVEMVRENKYDRLIKCKYDPKEPGDYQIEVKWANEHVPGSPFLVMIFDTQQELERFLSGQPVTPSPPLPFLPPGWIGPPPPGFMMPSPNTGPSQAIMMPPSPVQFRPPPRALTYGGGPPFPVYAGGSPRHQNGYH